MWRCYPQHSPSQKFDVPSVSEQYHAPMMRQQRCTQTLHDTVQLIRRDCFRFYVFPRSILIKFLTGLTRRRRVSEQTCANNNNTSTVTTNHVGLQREQNVDLDEHVFAICFGTVRGPIIKQQSQAPRSCHRQPRYPWSTSSRA